MTDENQEPGPRTTQSASRTAATASGTAKRIVRHDVHGLDLAGGERHVRLAPHGGDLVGTVRIVPLDQGLELQGNGGHGQHPAVRAEQLADQVESLDVIAELFPQGDDQQIADGVFVQVALGLEAVLDDTGPGLAPFVVAAQRRQRLAQITGRENAQLVTQAAAGTAVVGHGDDGGEVPGDPAQRGERGGQPHAAAEGDDLGLGAAAAWLGPARRDRLGGSVPGDLPAQPASAAG